MEAARRKSILPERSGAGKDARQRGEANPFRRAPFCHSPPRSTGGGAGTASRWWAQSFWSNRSGASWVYSIWIGCCRLGRELTLCFRKSSLADAAVPELANWLTHLGSYFFGISRRL